MKKIITSALSLVLIVAILAPTLVKLSHALFEHQEQLCHDMNSVHVHEIEFDCDFHKYQLSSQYYPAFVELDFITPDLPQLAAFNYYTFLSKYQKLPFALRGPPIS